MTLLGIGGYHVGWTSERDAQEIIEAALEGGIRFFDTAEGYQDGESERRYGKFLTPKYRESVFLMTKTHAFDAAGAREHLEGSLRRMKTDTIDLWQLPSLSSPGDTDGRFFGMKTMPSRGSIWQSEDPVVPNRISIRDALHFAWSLPVSVLITGAENASLVREKVDLAKTFKGMSEERRLELVNRVADLADGKVEYFKRPV